MLCPCCCCRRRHALWRSGTFSAGQMQCDGGCSRLQLGSIHVLRLEAAAACVLRTHALTMLASPCPCAAGRSQCHLPRHQAGPDWPDIPGRPWCAAAVHGGTWACMLSPAVPFPVPRAPPLGCLGCCGCPGLPWMREGPGILCLGCEASSCVSHGSPIHLQTKDCLRANKSTCVNETVPYYE